MLREIVLKQKKEKEYFLSLFYIERTKISQVRKWVDVDLIKVISKVEG
jgi:hypothetical protein